MGNVHDLEKSFDEREIKELFSKYDKNNTGCLSFEEWNNFAKNYVMNNNQLSPSDIKFIEYIFKDCDSNKDNTIEFDEFKKFMKEHRISLKKEFDEAYDKQDMEKLAQLTKLIRIKEDLKKVFQMALEKKDEQLLQIIAERYPNVTDEEGTTFLTIECKNRNIDNIKALISFNANPNIQDYMGKNCLHYLCSEKCPDVELLKLVLPSSDLNLPTIFMPGRTPLQLACENRNIELCKLLLESKAQPSEKARDGSSAVHLLIKEKDTEMDILKLLINSKANLNARDADKKFCLNLAIDQSDALICELLLEGGANPNKINPVTEGSFLHYILSDFDKKKKKKIGIVKVLLEYEADPNLYDKKGFTALHYEASNPNSSKSILRMLFETNVNPNMVTKDEEEDCRSPFHFICENENVSTEKIRFFVENKADVNLVDKFGQTPLHIACKNAYFHFDAIELLFQFNADPNIKDNKDESSIDIAKKNNRYDICSLFFANNKK